jgi:transcription initiation factor TFIIIB Brf1 subunit/transcription initiation factor TFIIB
MRQTARLREGRSSRRYARGEFLILTRSVHAIATKLKLAKEVTNRAEGICADAAAMGMSRFLPRPALAAAAVCVACREHKVPVTQRDLAIASGCDLKELGKSYAAILEDAHLAAVPEREELPAPHRDEERSARRHL